MTSHKFVRAVASLASPAGRDRRAGSPQVHGARLVHAQRWRQRRVRNELPDLAAPLTDASFGPERPSTLAHAGR